ncbi:MAG: DedA family protein [Alphaproteobacteria bacterium]|nr:DedA family protein [Alphaproteobacteria bacterium]
MIAETATAIVEFIHSLGYTGLFVATFLESTFVPIPSASTMIPAGYLAHEGRWSLGAVWLIAISGTIAGSLANYALAYYLGRPFFMRYGKYIHFGPHRLHQVDEYFLRHGEISIFTARLLPGVRHVISFPAGLARMNVAKFCALTGLGGGLWMTTLMMVGYTIGGNKDLVKQYMPIITAMFLLGVSLMVVLYIHRYRRKAAENGVA